MVRAERWRPRRLPEEETSRAVLSIAPGSKGGQVGSAVPAPKPLTQDVVGIEIWETDEEPTGAAVHDFWWDTSA